MASKSNLLGTSVTTAIVAGLLSGASSAAADPVAQFYSGRTLVLSVPAGEGSGFSLFSRLLVDHMPKYIPGKPTMIPNFRPGAGGATAASYMANAAAADGSQIALILSNSVLVSVLQPKQARFDARKFQWLGSMFHRTGAIWLINKAPATTLEGAKKLEIILGASGVGSETYQTPKLMNEILGTKFKIVTGYRSGAGINLAVERGELHGRQQNYLGWEAAGRQDWVVNKVVIPIVQTGPREPALGDVPSLRDLVKPGMERDLVELHEIGGDIGMAAYAPAAVPADRLAALRKAFQDALRDPELLAQAKKSLVLIAPKTESDVRQAVERAYGYPREVKARLGDILGFSEK